MSLVLSPTIALAQVNNCSIVDAAKGSTEQLGKCVSQVYLWSMGAAGVLALLMTIFGGYKVMTARGNAQQASDGKSFIYSSLLGIAILLGAYLLLSTINPDLTNFTFESIKCLQDPPPGFCPK